MTARPHPRNLTLLALLLRLRARHRSLSDYPPVFRSAVLVLLLAGLLPCTVLARQAGYAPCSCNGQPASRISEPATGTPPAPRLRRASPQRATSNRHTA